MSSPSIDFSKYEEKTTPAIDFSQYEEKAAQSPQTTGEKVMHGLKEFGAQVNPVSAFKGLAQLSAHPIDTYTADAAQRQQILDKGKEDFKKGNYGQAATRLLYGVLPFAGPNLERSGEQFQQGDIAGGIGSSLGQGVAMATPEVIKGVNLKVPVGGGLPARLYQSALKPSTTLSRAQVASRVSAGLENAIPVSADGITKINSLVQDLGDKVKQQIQPASDAGAVINKFKVASRLGDTAQQFETQVAPEADLRAVSDVGNEFLRNQPGEIPAAQAQSIKQGTYKQLSSKAYGELGTATTEAQKALARGIKEELETQFPEIKGLNAKEAELIGLKDSLERAVKRIDNHQMIGLGTPMAASAGALAGGAPGAGVMTLLKLVVDSPGVKSRLASALSRASKTGVHVGDATARVAGYSNALGNALPIAKQDKSTP